jgi:hypothetical protein
MWRANTIVVSFSFSQRLDLMKMKWKMHTPSLCLRTRVHTRLWFMLCLFFSCIKLTIPSVFSYFRSHLLKILFWVLFSIYFYFILFYLFFFVRDVQRICFCFILFYSSLFILSNHLKRLNHILCCFS